MAAELRVLRSDLRAPALATARWCASRGWPVHPLAAGRKTPAGNCEACRESGHTHQGCGCAAEGRWCHGFHAATLDAGRIEQWWGRSPALGVGVACGPAGLVVIDVDAHHQQLPDRDRLLPGITISEDVDLTGLASGFHTLAVLAALRGVTSPAADESTLRVRTPSGGLHVWYRARPGHRWHCSAGSSNGRALAWQVDVRAHGGYIVAPGTTTRDGTYTPLGPVREPAP
ncbi:bifunctional DNA primase/polymerase, partial [Streptomyces sp. T-3]|nr:bifunctional DNA primase/polymerase [Streptomyces sp. T-3]